MINNVRSHSPPLPPNATYHHPVVSLNILPSAKFFLAGSKLDGTFEVVCKEKNKVALGQLSLEFLGSQELRLADHSAQSSIHGPHISLFQGPSLPPSNAVITSEAPIGGHYYPALRGRTKFPFNFPLPTHLPSSTNFQDKAKVSYTLKASCQVLDIHTRHNVLVIYSQSIQIIENLADWNNSCFSDPVEMRAERREPGNGGAGVWAEVKINRKLHWIHPSNSNSDHNLIQAQLTVKNNSRRELTGGVNVKICKALVMPNESISSLDPSRIQVVRNLTFKGIDYNFPPTSNQPRSVNLICQLPNPSTDHSDNIQDIIKSSCLSTKAIKLFSIDIFLRIELELGALSDDLLVDLPIYVVHPASLPNEAIRSFVPQTIQHTPSINSISNNHLSQPPISQLTNPHRIRSTSPHPISLQPGLSRSTSPQPSQMGLPIDWPVNRTGTPSPVPSIHFSPLPTPRHSPIPSPRFSSPFPSSHPNHIHRPSFPASTSPFPSTSNWSNHLTPLADPNLAQSPTLIPNHPHIHQQQSLLNLTSNDSFLEASHVITQHSPSRPQPICSPPTTPWRRRTLPAPLQPSDSASISLTSSTQVNLPIQSPSQTPFSPHHMSHDSINHAQHTLGLNDSFSQEWRSRHQSLPHQPIMSSHPYQYSNPPDQHLEPAHTFTSPGLGLQHSSSSRRTSEPLLSNLSWTNPHGYQHQPLGPTNSRKRALPTPPSITPQINPSTVQFPTIHQEPSQIISKPHLQAQGSEAPCDRPSSPITTASTHTSHSRLETIGEAGESRLSTLSAEQLSQQVLDSFSKQSDKSEDLEELPQPFRPLKTTRVVSQPRGIRPRRSDGTESLQVLEDIAAIEDERRTSESSHDSSRPRTPIQDNQQLSFNHPDNLDLQHDAQQLSSQDASLLCGLDSARAESDFGSHQSQKKLDLSAPNPSPPRQLPASSNGLANLAQFLYRMASSQPSQSLPSQNDMPSLSTQPDNHSTADNGHNFHRYSDQSAQTSASNFALSALRMKSNCISYGETLIDAVPSPTQHKSPCDSQMILSGAPIEQSQWKPPSISNAEDGHSTRTSIVKQIDFDEDEEDHMMSSKPASREAIAPKALFPQFTGEKRLTFPDTLTPTKLKASNAPLPNQDSPHQSSNLPTPPSSTAVYSVMIPSVSPLVRKKNGKAQSTKRISAPVAVSSPSPVKQEEIIKSIVNYPVTVSSPSPAKHEEIIRSIVNHPVAVSSPSPVKQEKIIKSIVNHPTAASLDSSQDCQMTIVERLRIQNRCQQHDHETKIPQKGTSEPIKLVEQETLQTQGLGLVKIPTDQSGTQAIKLETKNLIQTDQIKFNRKVLAPTSFSSKSEKKTLVERCNSPSSRIVESESHVDVFKKLLSLQALPTASSLELKPTFSNVGYHRPIPSEAVHDPTQITQPLFIARRPTLDPASKSFASNIHNSSATSSALHSSKNAQSVDNSNLVSQLSPHLFHEKSRVDSVYDSYSKSLSPTNLGRKSRIKRQGSSPIHSSQPNSRLPVSITRGSCPAEHDALIVNPVPGGWNEAESNEIEAELIKALNETNLAVQKATSKRLSTPQFAKTPSFNTSIVLSNLLTKTSKLDGKLSDRNRRSLVEPLRLSASMNGVDEHCGSKGIKGRFDTVYEQGLYQRRLVDKMKEENALDATFTKGQERDLNAEQDKPIQLTSAEYQSMRGGRGGRVSSVAAQWAKRAAEEETKNITSSLLRSSELTYGDGPSHQSLGRKPSLLSSTRAMSIKERSGFSSSSYSIAGFLSRNSSRSSPSTFDCPPIRRTKHHVSEY
ncbi:hypothetical protein O181_032452 [Austropuccinia psidii MF-1]|uniref:Arrestin C-terminal-like domain-containing protein n=1 Tax=Austropuccinia psidii MF-1 TaxID=1389203 RepID=A0A9Q3D2M2_9BASI|nr:hypothetical protein [Austropuccinia psidii MF-1]